MSQIGVLSTGRRRQASRKRCDIATPCTVVGTQYATHAKSGCEGQVGTVSCVLCPHQERRATCWSSRTAWPPFQTRTVPLDWDTEMATALVSTVTAAAAAWRAPR